MTVGSVQDVMLAAVAVSSMDGYDAPQPNAAESSVQDSPQQTAMNETSAADAAQKQEQDARAQAQHEPLTEEQTSFITEQLNEIMRNIDVNLQFQYHKEVNFMSVRMLDKKTGEVLREVPPESMVEHMIKVRDWIGAFLDKTA